MRKNKYKKKSIVALLVVIMVFSTFSSALAVSGESSGEIDLKTFLEISYVSRSIPNLSREELAQAKNIYTQLTNAMWSGINGNGPVLTPEQKDCLSSDFGIDDVVILDWLDGCKEYFESDHPTGFDVPPAGLGNDEYSRFMNALSLDNDIDLEDKLSYLKNCAKYIHRYHSMDIPRQKIMEHGIQTGDVLQVIADMMAYRFDMGLTPFSQNLKNGYEAVRQDIVDRSEGNLTLSDLDNCGITTSTLENAINQLTTDEKQNLQNILDKLGLVYHPSSGGGGGGGITPGTGETEVEVIINGEPQKAANVTTETVDGKTVTTVVVDDQKIEEGLQAEGSNATITIPVTNADVVIGTLSGQTVKSMEEKEAVLEIKTENVTYTLPAAEINIDSISEQLGEQVELKDIEVQVKVAVPSEETTRIIEDTANKNNYQIVVEPVEFEITCTSGGKTVSVSKFNSYVERLIAIPEGIDPSRITTGVVLNNDGTFSHVPTELVVIDGKYYAKINSLTNSVYSVIYNPVTFNDVINHWAKNDVNDMGSRLVINGVGNGNFEPDRDITRAEFAAIAVRGLGLMRTGTGEGIFGDVNRSDWYYDAVSIAREYGLIEGYGDGTFLPGQKITREEAMAITARAMVITKLNTGVSDSDIEEQLSQFTDSAEISTWAVNSVTTCIKNGIIQGHDGKVTARENITRAEVATIVKRLLQKSDLI